MSAFDAYAVQRALSQIADAQPPTADESFRRLMHDWNTAYDERNVAARSLQRDFMTTPF